MKKTTLLSRHERYFKAKGGMIYNVGIILHTTDTIR